MIVGILEFYTEIISYNSAIIVDEETLIALCDDTVRKLRLKNNIVGKVKNASLPLVRSTASPLVPSIFVVCTVIGHLLG
jgi:hypothetical protein